MAEQIAPYAFNRSGGPIHRVVSFQRAACGAMGFDFHTKVAPNMSAFECWVTGWRPCARCFPDFDLVKWRELMDRYMSVTSKEGSERIFNEIWKEVYAERGTQVTE